MRAVHIIVILLSLIIPLLLVLTSFSSVALNAGSIIETQAMLGIQQPDKTKAIIKYIDTGNNQLSFLDNEELQHMKDVRNLVSSGKILMAVLSILLVSGLVYIIINFRIETIRYLSYSLMLASIVGFVSLFTFFYGALAFSSTFITFHNIFFEPGTWTFSASSTLIQLFPEQFFLNSTIRIMFSFSIMLLFLIVTTIIIAYFQKNLNSMKGKVASE